MKPARSVVPGLLILALLAVALVLAACGGQETTTSTQAVTTTSVGVTTTLAVTTSSPVPPGHWAQDGLSLAWPQGWGLDPHRVMPSQLESLLDFAVLCELVRSRPYGEVVLMARDLAPGETLQSLFDQTYAALPGLGTLGDLTGWSGRVSGLPALFKAYKLASGEPWYQYWDAWLEHDGRLYVLAGWAYVGDSVQVRPGFDQIMESLQVDVGQ